MSETPIQLIVGLGNPGPEYAVTRHNVGAWFVDLLARQYNIVLKYEKKFHGSVGKIKIGNHEIFLLIPSTYMNDSGYAIKAITNFYKIPIKAVLVAHDELDFLPGIVRLKEGGGHGGHNGLRHTIEQMGSSDFLRLRIGIGHPGNKVLVHDYVLSKPTSHESDLIIASIDKGLTTLPDLAEGKIQKAFQQLHNEG